jgi:hypothetical protein
VTGKILALYGVALVGVVAGCGAGTYNPPSTIASHATASPTPSPTPVPTPSPTASPTPIVVVALPTSLDFGGVNGSQQITVKETGYNGTFTAVSNDTTVVTVSPPSVVVSTATNPASTGVFVVTSIGIGANLSGATTVSISDGTHTTNVPVTVSVTSGVITFWVRPSSRLKT